MRSSVRDARSHQTPSPAPSASVIRFPDLPRTHCFATNRLQATPFSTSLPSSRPCSRCTQWLSAPPPSGPCALSSFLAPPRPLPAAAARPPCGQLSRSLPLVSRDSRTAMRHHTEPSGPTQWVDAQALWPNGVGGPRARTPQPLVSPFKLFAPAIAGAWPRSPASTLLHPKLAAARSCRPPQLGHCCGQPRLGRPLRASGDRHSQHHGYQGVQPVPRQDDLPALARWADRKGAWVLLLLAPAQLRERPDVFRPAGQLAAQPGRVL